MKIIVESEEEKLNLINESKYVHDFVISCYLKRKGKQRIMGLDPNKSNTLMHIYLNPDMVSVLEKDYTENKSKQLVKQSKQYAWWSEIDQRFEFVFPSKQQVGLCSPDFFQSSIEKREGEILPVLVSEITS